MVLGGVALGGVGLCVGAAVVGATAGAAPDGDRDGTGAGVPDVAPGRADVEAFDDEHAATAIRAAAATSTAPTGRRARARSIRQVFHAKLNAIVPAH